MDNTLHRVVVVGGGAGGLELATHLGRKLGRGGRAHITLIDKERTHFWKPHLHEIAAGSVDMHRHATDYLAQSHWRGFRYRPGAMVGLDRERREVHVAPALDDDGAPITPPYSRAYDTLVMAVGSQTNDFGTPGVAEHAIALESPAQAERFHARLVNACISAHVLSVAGQPKKVQVAIVGAGATGVELAAELRKATRKLVSYGLEGIDPERDIVLTLIEAGPRILPALPERIANAAQQLLVNQGVNVRTNSRVAKVTEHAVHLADKTTVAAGLVVWAAGIKAPTFLQGLAGLESNRLNQLVVRPTLQTTRDESIFAIGDCAAAPWIGREGVVPPRAQAAHQQAAHVLRQVQRRLSGRPLQDWTYHDFGSLVSLGEYSTVGNLMGALVGGSIWVDGLLARMMYLSLYKLHELALHGWWKTIVATAARVATGSTEPRTKLH